MKLLTKKGFTLVELLVVVGIISILSAILVPNVAGIRAKSRDTKRIADISQYRLALEHYFTINKKYPAALSDLSGGGIIPSPAPSDPSGSSYWSTYSGSGSYAYVPYCNGGEADANGYHLGAKLERNNEQLKGDSDVSLGGTLCSGATEFDGTDDTSSLFYYDLVNN